MTDKNCVQQVLGCLMKHPAYLSEIDKYNLTLMDFNSKFEQFIYGAIYGLYTQGATKISPLDITNYLESNTTAITIFNNQNGIEYLQDIEMFTNEENFDYYYSKLKKLNLLRDLKRQGIDTSEFYNDNLTDKKAQEINERFEELEVTDIIDAIKRKLAVLENNYAQSEEVQVEKMSDGIDEFFEDMDGSINIGVPIQGKIYNQVINGAMKGALTIRSGSSGLGKTRQAMADACYLAYPTHYSSVQGEWVQEGSSKKVLFIVTEQTQKQARSMAAAYLADMNESRFKYGKFNDSETKLLNETKMVMKRYEDNFILVKMPNPTIERVKALIREQVLLHNIEYVFYDYIFIGPALLNEFRGFNLRNDEVLLMFATALKDLAVELDVAMFTSTQVNSQADDNKNIRNESSLAGGRATINKADNGAIMARPTSEELETLKPLISECGIPNMVTDIFKVRSGEWTQVRIWSDVDLGRLKKRDLFITDSRMEPIQDFFAIPEYDVHEWADNEFQEIKLFVEELNND